jgi:hypothetical protein
MARVIAVGERPSRRAASAKLRRSATSTRPQRCRSDPYCCYYRNNKLRKTGIIIHGEIAILGSDEPARVRHAGSQALESYAP